MAQRLLLFLLWLCDTSSAGFPNQINIGECIGLCDEGWNAAVSRREDVHGAQSFAQWLGLEVD